MIRNLILLTPMLAFVAGCATSTVPPPSSATQGRIPRVDTSHREMAAYFMGRPDGEIKAPPVRDKSAKIQLDPTPGAQQIRPEEGQYRGEVLTSGPYSDGYVTETLWVPITRYFRVLREVDCDTTMWVTLVSPKMVRSNPMYVSGISRDADPSYGCEKHFHSRFKDGDDPDLAGADGVVIGVNSFEDHGGHGPFTNQAHVFMRSWAIKFEDPSESDVVWRLSHRPVSEIDVLQTRALAYWIEKNKAEHYRPLIRASLPRAGSLEAIYGWTSAQIALVKVLAFFADKSDHSLWMNMIRADLDDPVQFGNPRNPVAASSKNDYVLVAGNALACLSDRADIPTLEEILEKSARLPNKLVAAQLLVRFGREDVVRKIAQDMTGAAQSVFIDAADGKRLPFTCPFKVTYG